MNFLQGLGFVSTLTSAVASGAFALEGITASVGTLSGGVPTALEALTSPRAVACFAVLLVCLPLWVAAEYHMAHFPLGTEVQALREILREMALVRTRARAAVRQQQQLLELQRGGGGGRDDD